MEVEVVNLVLNKLKKKTGIHKWDLHVKCVCVHVYIDIYLPAYSCRNS